MRNAALFRSDIEQAVDERLSQLVQGATVLGPAAPIAIKAFTGREWDPETGLYYYRARYYDPKAGRFISEDPIGFEGGANFYSYVDNQPVDGWDPFGLVDFKGSAGDVKRAYDRLSAAKMTPESRAYFKGVYGVDLDAYLKPGNGATFNLNREGPNGRYGFCSPGSDNPLINLDEATSDELFLATLLHESTHFLDRNVNPLNPFTWRGSDPNPNHAQADAAARKARPGVHRLEGYMAEYYQFGRTVSR